MLGILGPYLPNPFRDPLIFLTKESPVQQASSANPRNDINPIIMIVNRDWFRMMQIFASTMATFNFSLVDNYNQGFALTHQCDLKVGQHVDYEGFVAVVAVVIITVVVHIDFQGIVVIVIVHVGLESIAVVAVDKMAAYNIIAMVAGTVDNMVVDTSK